MNDKDMKELKIEWIIKKKNEVWGLKKERERRMIRFVENLESGLFKGMVGWREEEGNGEWVVKISWGKVKGNIVRIFEGEGIVEE